MISFVRITILLCLLQAIAGCADDAQPKLDDNLSGSARDESDLTKFPYYEPNPTLAALKTFLQMQYRASQRSDDHITVNDIMYKTHSRGWFELFALGAYPPRRLDPANFAGKVVLDAGTGFGFFPAELRYYGGNTSDNAPLIQAFGFDAAWQNESAMKQVGVFFQANAVVADDVLQKVAGDSIDILTANTTVPTYAMTLKQTELVRGFTDMARRVIKPGGELWIYGFSNGIHARSYADLARTFGFETIETGSLLDNFDAWEDYFTWAKPSGINQGNEPQPATLSTTFAAALYEMLLARSGYSPKRIDVPIADLKNAAIDWLNTHQSAPEEPYFLILKKGTLCN